MKKVASITNINICRRIAAFQKKQQRADVQKIHNVPERRIVTMVERSNAGDHCAVTAKVLGEIGPFDRRNTAIGSIKLNYQQTNNSF